MYAAISDKKPITMTGPSTSPPTTPAVNATPAARRI
jgi:hypothetical protein